MALNFSMMDNCISLCCPLFLVIVFFSQNKCCQNTLTTYHYSVSFDQDHTGQMVGPNLGTIYLKI